MGVRARSTHVDGAEKSAVDAGAPGAVQALILLDSSAKASARCVFPSSCTPLPARIRVMSPLTVERSSPASALTAMVARTRSVA